MCSNCVRNNSSSNNCGCGNNSTAFANNNGCGCADNNGCGCNVLCSAVNGAASTVYRIVNGFDRSISCGGCGCGNNNGCGCGCN